MKKETIPKGGWGLLLLFAGIVLFPAACLSAQGFQSASEGGVVQARVRTIALHFKAYARVEPISILRLNAALPGIVNGITVLPGETVKAGSILGRLRGPAVTALLAQRRGSVASAAAALTAAEKILSIERQKQESHLTTQKAVYGAEADLAKARGAFDTARAQLRAARESIVLKAPGSGIVLTVNAADGEQVGAGRTILNLQPAGGLWLMARFYGSDAGAVRTGMTGQFKPAGGGAAIPVKVRTVIGPIDPAGGQAVGLVATVPTPRWLNGEAGDVTLSGAKRTYVAIPTRALILDRGRWWVLVRTGHGDQRREVVPGPSRGTSTLIKQGLEAGSRVVVDNAYLEFHRNLYKTYQQPD